MSEFVKDIRNMHKQFGVHQWLRDSKNKDKLRDFMVFRLDFLEEEFEETQKAFFSNDKEGVVDGLIDLIVVAIGTLDILGVDTDKAWDEVHGANMSKEPGIKESRPNPLGLPDMIKKSDWKGPNHEGNTGRLDEFLKIKNK